MPSDLEAAALAWRQNLLNNEVANITQLNMVYNAAWYKINTDVSSLYARMKDAEAAGDMDLAQRLKWRRDNAQDVADMIEKEMDKLALYSAAGTGKMQRDAVTQSIKDMTSLPKELGLDFSLTRPNFAAVEHLVGFAGDGSPLIDVYNKHSQGAAKQMTQVLARNLAAGVGIKETARDLRKIFNTGKYSAALVARTETLRSYRAAASETMKKNDDVIAGWYWISACDRRSCAACFAMHGTFHTLKETLDEHPGGRCVQMPALKGHKRFIESGEERLSKLPVQIQQKILGQATHQAWLDGAVTIDKGKPSSIAGMQHSQAWGDSVHVRSLESIVGKQVKASYVTEAQVQKAAAKAEGSAVSADLSYVTKWKQKQVATAAAVRKQTFADAAVLESARKTAAQSQYKADAAAKKQAKADAEAQAKAAAAAAQAAKTPVQLAEDKLAAAQTPDEVAAAKKALKAAKQAAYDKEYYAKKAAEKAAATAAAEKAAAQAAADAAKVKADKAAKQAAYDKEYYKQLSEAKALAKAQGLPLPKTLKEAKAMQLLPAAPAVQKPVKAAQKPAAKTSAPKPVTVAAKGKTPAQQAAAQQAAIKKQQKAQQKQQAAQQKAQAKQAKQQIADAKKQQTQQAAQQKKQAAAQAKAASAQAKAAAKQQTAQAAAQAKLQKQQAAAIAKQATAQAKAAAKQAADAQKVFDKQVKATMKKYPWLTEAEAIVHTQTVNQAAANAQATKAAQAASQPASSGTPMKDALDKWQASNSGMTFAQWNQQYNSPSLDLSSAAHKASGTSLSFDEWYIKTKSDAIPLYAEYIKKKNAQQTALNFGQWLDANAKTQVTGPASHVYAQPAYTPSNAQGAGFAGGVAPYVGTPAQQKAAAAKSTQQGAPNDAGPNWVDKNHSKVVPPAPKLVNTHADKYTAPKMTFASQYEYQDWIRKQASASDFNRPGITAQEKKGVRTWSGGAYTEINNALRGGHKLRPEMQEAVRGVDSAMTKFEIPETIVVWRGFSDDTLRAQIQQLGEANMAGQPYNDKGFMSSSIAEGSSFGGGFKGVITVTKGTKAMYIELNSNHPGEKELLLPRDSSYVIESVKYNAAKGYTEVHMTIIQE